MEKIAVNFGHPKVLWTALVLLLLLAIFLWATWRKRQALIRSFVQNKNLAQLTLGTSTAGQKLRRVLLLFAVASLLFTMARPQWGFTWEEASQRGRDIIVAIDTSRSMLAEDLAPNRLTRAKLAALDLLKLGKFDRFGLVAFSGTAFLQCPLTFDDEAFRQSVEILEPGIIPQGGTALSEAIDAARRAFAEDADENHRVLVLFTDGEDHERGIMETVSNAVDDGMRIFTVGVGTPAGELLRARDERGAVSYVKDEAGNVVKSRLNEQLLREIAEKGQGFYVQLQGANAMELLYQKGLAPLPTSERTTKLLKSFKEQFYWPLSIAILLLLLEVFIPEQKRAARAKSVVSTTPAATAVALLLLLTVPDASAAAAKAQRLYKTGEFNRALSEYQELLGKSPNDARLHFNAGAAAYQANKFDLALKEFQSAAASPDIDLQQQSFYNLGNSEYRLGQANANPQERMALWEQAVQHYDAALKLIPADKDAEFNRDLVRKKLEELKKQQEQQKQNENQDNKDKEQQDKDDKDQQKKDEQQEQQKDEKSKQEQNSDQQEKKSQQQQDQEQKQQEQNQQDQQQEKKDEKSSQSPPQEKGDKQSDKQPPEADGEGEAAQLGKMTPAQARQLLDAQKGDEKALIFVPPDKKSSSPNRAFKDW